MNIIGLCVEYRWKKHELVAKHLIEEKQSQTAISERRDVLKKLECE